MVKVAFIVIKQKHLDVNIYSKSHEYCMQTFAKIVHAETKEGAVLQVTSHLGITGQIVDGRLTYIDADGWEYSSPDTGVCGWSDLESEC
jgi:hypothetical protein